jgi:hypothetical protein
MTGPGHGRATPQRKENDLTIAPEANPNAKGSRIEGGLISHEALSSADLLDGKPGGGAQQYFTPLPAAELIARVVGENSTVFDPTAGDGSLLVKFHPDRSYGVELDPDQVKNSEGSYHALTGDVQHAFTLIRRAVTFDAVIANPPFGKKWSEPTLNDGKETNSALLTLMMANRLIDPDEGEVVFICGAGKWASSIASKPDAQGIYAVIEVEDLFAEVTIPAAICFGLHPRNPAVTACRSAYPAWEPAHKKVSLDMLELLPGWVSERRMEAVEGAFYGHRGYLNAHNVKENWGKIVREYDRRRSDRLDETNVRGFDLQMFGGDRLDVKPSPWAQVVLRKMDKTHIVSRLDGVTCSYFIQNERDWNFIKTAEADGILTVDPRLTDRVELLLTDTRRVLCPLYPLKPVQRLGFLSDVDGLICIKSDPEKGFDAGARYDLETKSLDVRETEKRPHQIASGPRAGEWEDREYVKRYKALQIQIAHLRLTDRQVDGELIQYVVDHFDIPDPGDVATRYPDEVTANLALLDQIEQEMIDNADGWDERNDVPEHKRFTGFRAFQKQDLARLLVKEDGFLAWEQGLGKTVGGLAFIRAHELRGSVRQQSLIVCPKDLIPQWTRETERLLGRKLEVIKTHGQAKRVARELKAGAEGMYITYHEALSIVGTNKSKPAAEVVVEERTEEKLVPGTDTWGYWVLDDDGGKVKCATGKWQEARKAAWNEAEGTYEANGTFGHGHIPARFRMQTKQLTSKHICPSCKADRLTGWNGLYCSALVRDASNGSTRECGYAHYGVRVKPIGSLLTTAFRKGTVVLDEATMVGGSAGGSLSQRLQVMCGIRSKRTLGMTGTPIKNFIIQLFYPLWFSLGNNTPRFPYGYHNRPAFLTNFAVEEVAKMNGKQVAVRQLPQITNLSLFWRMMASSTIRRRVDDTGEPIVPISYFDINAPLGKNQLKRINMWAKHFPEHFREKFPEKDYSPEWVQQAAPLLGLLQKNEYSELMPQADPDVEFQPSIITDPLAKFQDIEPSNFTPAVTRAMEVVMALVKNGEKVLVGSPLVLSSRFVAEQLTHKGVKAIHILDSNDSTQSPDARAATVFDFQTNDVDVLCAGLSAIRFGHNLDAASAVVLIGLPWDYETMDQFVKRVRRLTSQKPVRVFVIVPGTDTVTAKKWDLLKQKGDTASLALDGRIIRSDEVEIDRTQLLRELMEKGVQVNGNEVDEADVQTAWEQLPHITEYNPPQGLIPVPPKHWSDLMAAYAIHRAKLYNPPPAKQWSDLMAAYAVERGRLNIRLPARPVEVTKPEAEAVSVDLAHVMAKIEALEAKNAELEAKLAAAQPQQLTLDFGSPEEEQ